MASIQLHDFDITENAFLPSVPPLSHVDHLYYKPWEAIAQDLPDLIRQRTLRNRVIQLPILTTEHLTSEPEWRRAYTMLVFIAHAYIWGGDKPEEILPSQISIPLLSTATHVELPPVLNCAAVNLWNYTLQGRSLSNPDDLEIHTTFTGTESESWFLRIGIAIEAKGVDTVQPLLNAFRAVPTKNYSIITESLRQLKDSLCEITSILGRMHEKCDPMTFCHQIRPFYAGSKGVSQAGLPRGVFYDEGQGKGEWLQLPGGSNGQSALMQLFDLVLGIGFNGGDPSRKREGYYYNTRQCTPGPHRRFLALVDEMGSIRDLALQEPETDEQRRLGEAYAAAAEALGCFRSKHIQIVSRFVTMQLRRDWHGSRQSNDMPELLPSGLGDDARHGTAGMIILQFLKKLRDETTIAGKLVGP